MRCWLFFLLFLVVGVVSCQARGGMTVANLASCTFAGTAASDGCNGAQAGLAGKSIKYGRSYWFGTCSTTPSTDNYTCPSAGVFQNGYAQQYAQTYKQLPQWNVAGVDYPVGIPANVNGTGVLKDPATIHSETASCVYAASVITCTGTNNLNVSGFDLSMYNGVEIDCKSCTGTVTFSNNYWKRGTSGANYVFSFDPASTAGINVSNNYFDDDYATNPTSGVPNGMIYHGGTTATCIITSSYNAYMGNRFYALLGPSSIVSQYDYFEGLNYSTDYHGEALYLVPQSGVTVPVFKLAYSTYLQPAAFGSGVSAFMWTNVTCGGGGSCAITNQTMDHNVMAVNPSYFTGYVTSQGASPATITVTSINAQAPIDGSLGQAPLMTAIGQAGTWDKIAVTSTPGNLGTWTLFNAHASMPSQTFYFVTSFYFMTYILNDRYTYGSVNITNNYFDSSGSNQSCFLEKAVWAGATVTGNYNMLDGSGITYTNGQGGACNGGHN